MIQTHLQISGRNLGFRNTAEILYKDEGLFRFWNGAQVIASGCIPAHASYFAMYEYLKKKIEFNNQKYEFASTAMIGGLCTFAHDFFITPADGKIVKLISNPNLQSLNKDYSSVNR